VSRFFENAQIKLSHLCIDVVISRYFSTALAGAKRQALACGKVPGIATLNTYKQLYLLIHVVSF